MSVLLPSCSHRAACAQQDRPPFAFASSPYDALFRADCDHIVLSVGPFCVRRPSGFVLAGPQPDNRWPDAPAGPTGPWIELIGPLPSDTHRKQALSSDGRFDFGPLAAGRYLAKASACGWQSAYFLLTVSPEAPAAAVVVVELPLGV